MYVIPKMEWNFSTLASYSYDIKRKPTGIYLDQKRILQSYNHLKGSRFLQNKKKKFILWRGIFIFLITYYTNGYKN